MSKSLLETNPYLRDPATRRAGLRVSAASSSAVEGIYRPFSKADPARKVDIENMKLYDQRRTASGRRPN